MRALKAIVVGLGVLCVGAFGFLVWLVASGGGGKPASVKPPDGAPVAVMPSREWGDIDLGMPAGSRVLTIAGAGDALAIHMRLPDGTERIVIVDPRSGTQLGRIVSGEK